MSRAGIKQALSVRNPEAPQDSSFQDPSTEELLHTFSLLEVLATSLKALTALVGLSASRAESLKDSSHRQRTAS